MIYNIDNEKNAVHLFICQWLKLRYNIFIFIRENKG